jgi:hypothetical protein
MRGGVVIQHVLTIIDEQLNREYTLGIPPETEYYVLEYYRKFRVIPLRDSINTVAKLAKQGVKVRLK